jgi:hypothetical protein
VKLALAISIAFALFACVCLNAQPMPPTSAIEQEPPQTFTRTAAWNPVADATGLRLTVSNAAVNYVVQLPGSAISNEFQAVLGTNYLTLTATNSAGAGTTKTNWLFVAETRIRLVATPEGWVALTNAQGLPATNPPNQFARLVTPSVLTLTNGSGVR